VSAIVTQLGPLGVFLLMVPESACIPVPSEATLLAAGFAVRQGLMPFWLAVLAAVTGNLVGSLIAYGLGRLTSRAGGQAWVVAGVRRCDGLFARRGSWSVLLARLMPLARTFVSLPAGHARVRIVPFVAMTVFGCAVWAGAFVTIGVVVGSGWRELGDAIGIPMLLVGGIALVCLLLWRRGGSTAGPGCSD
jgi:membrane protein DedA with SNARE-associated domain